MTPQERAERSAAAMLLNDATSRMLGMVLREVGPGQAVMSMIVKPDHLNGHGICHGGIIFALADSTFAFACNSYNQIAVAQHNSITYVSPGQPGEELTARAVEVARAGRSGTYDVTITAPDGRVVALFRGGSRTIRGTNFDEQEPG